MSNTLCIDRKLLPRYLRVFNSFTDQPMGWIGELSCNQLMLMSTLPMLVGARFEMYVHVPTRSGNVQVDLVAVCQWCHEDINPSFYDSGFSIMYAAPSCPEVVAVLNRYFSFPQAPAAAQL